MPQHLYQHKITKELYTIEHLIIDLRFLNRNAFSGIYAYPYKNKHKPVIEYTKGNCQTKSFDPLGFVATNFNQVCELW